MTDAEPQQTPEAGEPATPAVPPAPAAPPAGESAPLAAPTPQQWAPPQAPQWAPPPAPPVAPPAPPAYGQAPPAFGQYGQAPSAPTGAPSPQSPYGQPASGQPQYGQPAYGQPAQPAWGQPAYGQPQYGQPAYGQPQYGQTAQPTWAQPAAGWTPPPKPGLIPLRPLSFGTLMGAPYQMLRRNPKATFGSALLIQGIVAVATVALFVPLAFFFSARLENASASDAQAIAAGTGTLAILAGIVVLIVALAGSAFLQGIIVLEAARATLGEKLRMGQLWRIVSRRLLPLTLWLLLVGLASVIAVAIVVGIAIALYAAGLPLLPVAIIWTVLGVLGLIALAIWLYTKTLLVPCIIVLERQGIRRAVQRSWTLVRGSFWKVFGVYALVVVIIYVATQIIATPISLVATTLTGNFTPTGAPEDSILPIVLSQGLVLLVTLIIQSIASVVQSGVVALLYIDRRMRREALDLELLRAVEARESGEAAADPYATPAFATA